MDINKILNSKDELPYLTLIVVLFGFISIFLFSLGNVICSFIISCPIINIYIPEIIINFLLFLNIVFFVIVVVRGIDWIQQFNKRAKREYLFDSKTWPAGWIFNGRPEIQNNELWVQRSRSGLLLEAITWKNFLMTFEMKFDPKRHSANHIGIIFRARDLDNYFMVEIRGNGNGGIAPHIRYKSGWEAVEEIVIENENRFDFGEFKKIGLKVVGETATLFYEKKEVLKWLLPTHVDVRHFESGVKEENEKKGEGAIFLSRNFFGNHTQKIPFRNEYGMIGFRAYFHNQGAVIRDLKLEPIKIN